MTWDVSKLRPGVPSQLTDPDGDSVYTTTLPRSGWVFSYTANPAAGPGRRNEDILVARPGSSAASRFSISASIRCSSIDSAIAPYLRVPRASGNYPNYPPRGGVYPIVPYLCLTLSTAHRNRLRKVFHH